MSALAEPEAARTILESLWRKAEERPNAHHYNLARLLFGIAKHWAFRPPEELELIKRAESRFRPPKQGMTERNRAKLRPLVDKTNLRRFLNLPRSVIESLDPDRPTVSEAVVVQSALAVAILFAAPVREKNLASFDLGRHIDRVSKDLGFLTFPANEVKNERDLEFPLSPRTLAILDLYLTVYRPLLLKTAKTSKLFVSWNGRPKTPAELGAQIPKFVKRRLGLDVNLHLFRHLAGYVFLRRHPGEYEPVRQLLGHKSLKTTIDFYTGLEHADSFRRYDEVLNAYREETSDAA